NFYGLMKMASEQQLAGMDGLDYAVGRLAAVYGLNRAIPSATRWDQGIGLGDLPNYYVKQFHRGEPVEVWSTGAVNEAAHPTLASDAAEMLVKLARSTLRGTFHTCGSESCTRTALAHRCARVFGGDPGLIQEVALDPEVARQHADIRPPYRLVMSVDKTAQLLDHRAYGVDGGLEVFKRQLEEEDLL
ncbi:MAG: sugar nucleotide-binding protein, partial [Trueperaceae bacterium]